MVDASPDGFVMHGARDAMNNGLLHIEEQIEAIERAVDESPGLAFDFAKTLVESVCRAVLEERSVPAAKDDDLPKLFKLTTQTLPFLPPAASSEADLGKSLRQTLSGLHTVVQGICELRNQCGAASHGSASARPALEGTQARLAAEASDTIVGFLHRIHREDRIPTLSREAIFDDNPEFNAYLDDTFGSLQVDAVEFQASEVLFAMEPESYRIFLAEFDGSLEEDEAGK